MTIEQMTARRDALLEARWRGVRAVDIDGRRIADASAGARRRIVRTAASKGL